MIELSKNLYTKLPSIYQHEDSLIKPNPYPLKRFLKVLGGGLDFTEDKITEFSNMLNIDMCPPQYLPLLADMMGITFPFDMDVATQRRFLKILPTLYKYKGTPLSFEYLAREIFGSSSVIYTSKETYKDGMTPEEWRRIFVNVELDGDTLFLGNKEENFRKIAEILRPVNRYLIINLILFYIDDYKFLDKVKINYDTDILNFDSGREMYRLKLMVDGVNHYDYDSGLFLTPTKENGFVLNTSKLYRNQVVELIDKIQDEYSVDIMRLGHLDDIETYDFKRLNDFLPFFNLNGTNLNAIRNGLGYSGEQDNIIMSPEIETFNRKTLDNKDFSLLKVPVDLDQYRKRKIIVDGVDNANNNTFSIVGNDLDTAFVLNKGKTYGGQVIEYKTTLYDEDVSSNIIAPVDEEISHIRGNDSLEGFVLNRTNISNKQYGINNVKLDVTLTDELGQEAYNKTKIKESDGLTSMSQLDEEESYSKTIGDDTTKTDYTMTRNPSLMHSMNKLVTNFRTTDFIPVNLSLAY